MSKSLNNLCLIDHCIQIGITPNNPTRWSDGSLVTYTNWCATQPDENGGVLSMMWGDQHYDDGNCWADYGADDSFYFIKEMQMRKDKHCSVKTLVQDFITLLLIHQNYSLRPKWMDGVCFM